MRGPGRTLRWGRGAACAASGWALATSAHAQVSTSIGVDSDYRYRGVSLSDSRPTVRLALNYDAPEHWYGGASATHAVRIADDSATQAIGYAGWVSAAVDGRSVEIGVDGSHFAGISGYDFVEAYVGLLAKEWSARAYFAPNYYGRHVRVGYVELNSNVSLDPQVRVFAHVGALVPLGAAASDAGKMRGDVSVGAGWALRGWDLRLAAVAATPGGPYPAVYTGRRAAVVAGAAFFF